MAAAEQSGQFELRNWGETYLREGRFDKDRMLVLVQKMLEGGRQQGFVLTRVVPHMESAEERPNATDRTCMFDDLVEYETRLNYIWPLYKDAVICAYDLAKFGGHIVIDVLRTHPMVLIGVSTSRWRYNADSWRLGFLRSGIPARRTITSPRSLR